MAFSILSSLLAAVLVSTAIASLCPAVTDPNQQAFIAEAKAVLDGNWVMDMNSTLPSPNLYPHQWSWDSSFISIGYSHYDTHKAIAETDALFRGQWRNGLLPHIVFNPNADESYFPGPSFWKIETSNSFPLNSHTSGIVQPPVHAIASLAIYNNARSPDQKALAKEHLRTIYPKLVDWHNYLYRERDPLNENLVYIRHMWESGMDNSPAWDDALKSIHLTPEQIPDYTRVDKGKVGDHHERPSAHFYDRAVHLIKIFYDNKYDETAIFAKSPFIIQDVLFNSILARAGDSLADIAEILGKTAEANNHREQATKTAQAITSKLYHEEDGFFYDYDMVSKKLIRSKISGGLVGVFGAKMSSAQLKSIVRHLREPGFLGPDLSAYTIPSVSRDDPGYTNTTYWKGPAWININYLVRDGLLRNADGNKDAEEISSYLKERSIEMLQTAGFYEYFNPISGSPHGGHQFSWSAALTIDWMCSATRITSTDSLPVARLILTLTVLLAAAVAAFLVKNRCSKAENAVDESMLSGDGSESKAQNYERSNWSTMTLHHLRRRSHTPTVVRPGRSN
ncbi:unnamed protein product [Agarophyton chilense]|eukprot:gb/GEZJ01001022.1/.p1 GENE.gb/GEZJ01001022.1/~~gb/GEZJ01001022.1/.p1  ORF type:complete len:565 (-),score=75.90 gb/GEZJ01001022.1/:8631-10325(-)